VIAIVERLVVFARRWRLSGRWKRGNFLWELQAGSDWLGGEEYGRNFMRPK
jgi:hypothetical protein